MVRRLIMLLGLWTACCPDLAVAQVYKVEAPQWFTGTRDIALPFEVGALEQGPGHTILLLGASANELALLDPSTGEIGPVTPLPGAVQAIAADALTEVAVISRADDGSLRLQIFARSDGLDLSVWMDIPVETVGPLTDPALLYATVDAGKRGEDQVLVIAERAAEKDPSQHAVYALTGRGFQLQPGRDWPSLLLPIGLGSVLLGLDDYNITAVLQDLTSGEVLDAVPFDTFSPEARANISLFSPDLPEGATPNVLMLNPVSHTLTVLSVGMRDRPLIEPFLQVPLGGDDGLGKGRLMAVSDRDMQLIVLGAADSAKLNIFRRLKGGIDPKSGAFALNFPLRAMTAITGPAGDNDTAFAFLSQDGRTLALRDLPSLEGNSNARADVPGDPTVQPMTPAAVRNLDMSEIRRIQRRLAALGYNVGKIDGLAGVNTETALRAFQVDSGLPPTGRIDEATTEALEAALSSGRTAAVAQGPVERFNVFLAEAMGEDFDGSRLMTLGAAQENPDALCFGLNDFAPENVWPNAVKFANLLKHIETEGMVVEIIAGYQSPAAGRCLSPKLPSSHGDFLTFDIILAGTSTLPSERADGIDRLRKLIKYFEDSGLTTVSLSEDGLALHVTTLIGANQAVISSYGVTERDCALAKGDVAEFAQLLAGTALTGLEIMVTRQAKPVGYVVSVDTNGQREQAQQATALIRRHSAKSADTRTGSDAFVMTGSALAFDPDCAAVQVIPAKASKS